MKQSVRLSVALSALLVAATPALAEPPSDLRTHAQGASKIVVAHVGAVRASFRTNKYGDRLIVSRAALIVEETLKGNRGASLLLDVEGGTVGNLSLHVSDLPELKPGERAVFFLDEDAGVHVPHQRGFGILKLDRLNRIADSSLTLDDVRAAVRAGR